MVNSGIKNRKQKNLENMMFKTAGLSNGHEEDEQIILSCADYFGKIELNTNDLMVNETFIKTIKL